MHTAKNTSVADSRKLKLFRENRKKFLVVGDRKLALDSLEAIYTVRPEHGRPAFTMARHRDGYQTILHATLPEIDDLFCEAAASMKRGWTPIYDETGDRCLLNLNNLSTRRSQRGAFAMPGGMTEFVNAKDWRTYRIGLEYKHSTFLFCILPMAKLGMAWNLCMAAPLAPIFKPRPQKPKRRTRKLRPANITQMAA